MIDTILNVLNKHGIQDQQKSIAEEISYKLTKKGYIDINNITLDNEKIVTCIADILNRFKEDMPIIIKG